MNKLLESYVQNPIFLKTLVILVLSFAFAIFGSAYKALMMFNKSKVNKKISVEKRVGKTMEAVSTCFIISIFVAAFAWKLDYDFLKIILVSIVFGISSKGIADKLNEKDFWEKVLELMFKNKLEMIKKFFDKRGPK